MRALATGAATGAANSEELLLGGGGENLLVSTAVEGELVPTLAHEYRAPRAPLLFGAQNDQLLFAPFARKDDLLARRTLHV